jgi:hypothetical protein
MYVTSMKRVHAVVIISDTVRAPTCFITSRMASWMLLDSMSNTCSRPSMTFDVVQWAAVFNDVQFASSTPPARLLDLRRLIGGFQMERAHGKLTIISASLRESEGGRFLMECLPILREWDSRLQQLTGDWTDIEMNDLASEAFSRLHNEGSS